MYSQLYTWKWVMGGWADGGRGRVGGYGGVGHWLWRVGLAARAGGMGCPVDPAPFPFGDFHMTWIYASRYLHIY